METLALVSVLECGVGDNHWGWNASATYNGVGVGYGLTYYGKTQGPDGKSNAQRVANITAYWKGGSFMLQNDMKSLGGDGDRWRTNAFELSIGNFSFGSYIYTNDGKADSQKQQDENARSPIWGENRNKGYSTWKMDRFSLLLYGLGIEEEIKLRALVIAMKRSKTCSRTEFTGELVLEIRIFT